MGESARDVAKSQLPTNFTLKEILSPAEISTECKYFKGVQTKRAGWIYLIINLLRFFLLKSYLNEVLKVSWAVCASTCRFYHLSFENSSKQFT